LFDNSTLFGEEYKNVTNLNLHSLVTPYLLGSDVSAAPSSQTSFIYDPGFMHETKFQTHSKHVLEIMFVFSNVQVIL
jgi:hypothetical protein